MPGVSVGSVPRGTLGNFHERSGAWRQPQEAGRLPSPAAGICLEASDVGPGARRLWPAAQPMAGANAGPGGAAVPSPDDLEDGSGGRHGGSGCQGRSGPEGYGVAEGDARQGPGILPPLLEATRNLHNPDSPPESQLSARMHQIRDKLQGNICCHCGLDEGDLPSGRQGPGKS